MASGGYPAISFTQPNCSVENVECRVCDDVFNIQGDKVPRLLHCGHTVCHQCLTRIPQHGNIILCPFDRQPTNVGDSGVWSLKKNFALIELLEKLNKAYSFTNKIPQISDEKLEREKKLDITCDENDAHKAVLYCVTCCTNLCIECAEFSHSTKTLAKHKRVPLSEKPKEIPKCTYHPMHLIEFVCQESECQKTPLMCYICKDYGRHVKHKHTLLDYEAQNVRTALVNASHMAQQFGNEVTEWGRKLNFMIQQIEGGIQVIQEPDGVQRTNQVQGTAEEARNRVRQYFSELHETLKRQEIAALTIVDTHVRERLCMMRQQQEDMATLLSQISSICYQCDKTLQEDDDKVILAKQDVNNVLENIRRQQQQFADIPDQLQADPSVPITFTKDNRVHIGPKMEMRVVTLGLDDSGKTSILFRLKQDEFIQTIPTIGFNVETVEYKNLKFTIWDVGGQQKLRPLWKHYYFNTQALIYVVDSSNTETMDAAYKELTKLLQEKELKDASLLLFANKQDKETSLSIEEITAQFNLYKLCCNRSWHIQACDAKSGAGLFDGLEWLSHQLIATGV